MSGSLGMGMMGGMGLTPDQIRQMYALQLMQGASGSGSGQPARTGMGAASQALNPILQAVMYNRMMQPQTSPMSMGTAAAGTYPSGLNPAAANPVSAAARGSMISAAPADSGGWFSGLF